MKKLTLNLGLGVILAAMLMTLIVMLQTPKNILASIQTGEGYFATSSPVGVSTITTLKNGPGMLGSVIVIGSNSGHFALYNATTSDITKRTLGLATSTVLIADFPANTSTSTYQFDTDFTYGLLFVGSGNIATSTITWK